MSRLADPSGAAAIGWLSHLPEAEAETVVFLRLWCDGEIGQAEVRAAFEQRFGGSLASQMAQDLHDLVSLLTRHARRPLCRHEVTSPCVAMDECALARFIGIAARGDHEDALMFAMLLVRPDIAPGLTTLAQQVGVALHQLSLSPLLAQADRGTHQPLH
ncbi:MAG: hypothetical protein ACPGNV_07635 [Mangrovicoccus sp.]